MGDALHRRLNMRVYSETQLPSGGSQQHDRSMGFYMRDAIVGIKIDYRITRRD